ncbi:MAG: RNA polymerase sigma factor [Deltaproteobacteria bacterium]|nr:RNA polymerase sigma factor [Deltaproteobacteria bacterium]
MTKNLSRAPSSGVDPYVDRETEQKLVARLREADAAAFDQVYELFRARLFGFLVRLSKRQDVAEDLLQETWIRLATKAAELRPDTHLAAWLFTVARNLFISYRRWRLLDANRVQELSRVQILAEGPDCPFESVAAGELELRLEQALASLPLQYREVILLVAIEEISPAAVAEICGLKPAALRKRLSRARKLLAKKLNQKTPGLYPVVSEAKA